MENLHAFSISINDDFSLKQTFECGQCFRWRALGEEHYRGTAFGKTVEFELKNGVLSGNCSAYEFEKIWRPYLDLDRDYAEIRRLVSIDEKTADCVRYGSGIRILQQDPWEALCSFILSQCNNIPRICGIIDRLCETYGEPLGDGSYTFPCAEQIAMLRVEDLACLRSGYRAPYVLAAAQAVADGSLDFSKLSQMNAKEALSTLTALPGVGIKVASCMLLFGLHKLDAFPVDTWMKKAIIELYGKNFDPAKAFGEYAGIAQQYIFYHTRQNNRK